MADFSFLVSKIEKYIVLKYPGTKFIFQDEMGVFKNRGKPPKWIGENNGKPNLLKFYGFGGNSPYLWKHPNQHDEFTPVEGDGLWR